MLTFKQTIFILVSIITILAIIAIVTGLSPLYWPHPKIISQENNSIRILIADTTSTTKLNTPLTTRLKSVTKKILPLTTVTITTALPITTNMIKSNTTIS
ncbi:unnamed protein product [Adineta steineri]|uniref:Uncharacterized protein n=1 Tax=Adineta steineri TaxID=433720 RepID=A0A814JU02_9BILA|nr:unnamed protein product [Adineta steineri]CAF4024536.1 unnamed protein product [Adineta steineri]